MKARELLALSVLGLSALLPCIGNAQKYRSQPVRIVVGFQAGGGTDIAGWEKIVKIAGIKPE